MSEPSSSPSQEVHVYYIEVAAACNLRCPSCPNGNSRDPKRARGHMDPQLLSQILEKITQESPARVTDLYFVNWGEPTLHPDLPRLIELARSKGLPPHLSSNLAAACDLREIVKAGPKSLRISLSGYDPEVYKRMHYPGDVWMVKSNAYRLRSHLNSLGSDMPAHFCYHQYVHNMGADLENVRHLAEELGFAFEPVLAFLAPLERYLDYLKGTASPEVRNLVNQLLVRPEEAKAAAYEHARRHPAPDCGLRACQTVIDFNGQVSLCCAVYEEQNNLGVHFLDAPHAELQRLKYAHPLCRICMQHYGHLYYLYAGRETLDRIAKERLQALNGTNAERELFIPGIR